MSYMTALRISIIVPAYNEERYIKACLQSILEAKTPNVCEIIVVDNLSTDATAAIAKSLPGITVVKESTKGTSAARQRGFLEASGDILAFVDADSVVSRQWFAFINREFLRQPKLACLSGPYRFTDLSKWQNACVKMYWNCLAFPAYLLTRYMVVGGNFAVRRAALEAIDGFDTSIAFYGDDTDIARRLHSVGKVRFHPFFYNHTSARRLKNQGIMRSGATYVANYLSAAVLKRPLTKRHSDIR